MIKIAAVTLCFLATLVAAEPRFSPPALRYQVDLADDVCVPMRGGVKLAMDIYRSWYDNVPSVPSDLFNSHPWILSRNPLPQNWGKSNQSWPMIPLVRSWYSDCPLEE